MDCTTQTGSRNHEGCRTAVRWFLLVLLISTSTAPAAGAAQPRYSLPGPSPAVLELSLTSIGVARSNRASPSLSLPQISLPRSAASLDSRIARPMLAMHTRRPGCDEAVNRRDMGGLMVFMSILGMSSGALGVGIGVDDHNEGAKTIGGILLVVSAITMPIGFVLGAEAAKANRESGCWGQAAAAARETNPLVIEVRGQVPPDEDREPTPEEEQEGDRGDQAEAEAPAVEAADAEEPAAEGAGE